VLFTAASAWRAPFTEGCCPRLFAPGQAVRAPAAAAVLLEGALPDAFAGRPAGTGPGVRPAGLPPAGTRDPLQRRPASRWSAAPRCSTTWACGRPRPLLLLSVDALTHGEEMISIRSKSLTQRVIRPVETPKLGFRLFAAVLVPVGRGLRPAARREAEGGAMTRNRPC
jgi:hypothetical protein